MNDQAALSARWHALAARTAFKVNLAWWQQKMEPLLALAGVIVLVGLLYARHQGLTPSLSSAWPWLLLLPALGFAAYLPARRQFITPQQAYVRLEAQLALHNALSCAQAGKRPWPPVPPQMSDGWHWRWPQVLLPWLGCAASIVLGLCLPLSQKAPTLPKISAEPQAWQQMEEWLKKLEEEKFISPQEKEEQAAKVSELREQPQEKWFSHDSLHATDSLKEQLQRDLARLGQNMNQAERSLNALQNYADQLSQAAKDQLLKDLDEAIQGLKNSPLELDPELLKQLSQMDPSKLPALSQEQMDQLREALKKGSQLSQEMAPSPGFLGDGEGEDDALSDMLGEMRRKDSPGNGQENQPGDGPGEGDIQRGPGTAPLTLAEQEDDFGTDKKEGIANPDLSRAQAGSMLGTKDGKHEVDKTYDGPRAAGAAAHQGEGGDQVWKETLTPDEKAVLKRVFR
ncbi:MAG TPA: hypothetical protein VGE29_02595 [Prosthecobacter sp.]